MPSHFTRFWAFLQDDTWASWIVSLILIVIVIRFIFFPFLSFVTGSPLPLVVVESCSMYHESQFDDWWFRNSEKYFRYDIGKKEFNEFDFKRGLSKGDIILLWGYGDYTIGDVIVFQPVAGYNLSTPVIHRIISEDPIGTFGDNNPSPYDFEETIPEETILGKAVLRVPAMGWFKLIFFEIPKYYAQVEDPKVDISNIGTCFGQNRRGN